MGLSRALHFDPVTEMYYDYPIQLYTPPDRQTTLTPATVAWGLLGSTTVLTPDGYVTLSSLAVLNQAFVQPDDVHAFWNGWRWEPGVVVPTMFLGGSKPYQVLTDDTGKSITAGSDHPFLGTHMPPGVNEKPYTTREVYAANPLPSLDATAYKHNEGGLPVSINIPIDLHPLTRTTVANDPTARSFYTVAGIQGQSMPMTHRVMANGIMVGSGGISLPEPVESQS